MQITEGYTEAHNVTMYPEHWDLVDWVARQHGIRTRSGALQKLVDEYRALKERDKEPLPTLPTD